MSINAIQQELLKSNKILEIEADIILPRVGGYSARPYSITLNIIEGIRATELKALWRWWMRTVISRVYGGKEDLKTLDERVSEILGGKVPGDTSKASHFSIQAEIINEQVVRESLNWHKKLHTFLTEELEDILNRIYNGVIRLCRDRIKITKLKIRLKPPITIDIYINNVNLLEQRLLSSLTSREVADTKRIGRIIKKRKSYIRILIESSEDFNLILSTLCNIIDANERYNLNLYDDLVKLSRIPRITLLSQRRSKEESDVYALSFREEQPSELRLNDLNKHYLRRISEDLIPPHLRVPVKITIFENIKHDISEGKARFAIAVLLLGLLLGGVGSITRRAFGSIVVKSIKVFNEYNTMLSECISKFENILNSKTSDELEKNIWKFIKYVIEKAEVVYGKSKNIDGMPEVLTLFKEDDKDRYFKLKVVEIKDVHEYLDGLKLVGNATLKVEWKRCISQDEREPGGEFHTWILGLPRSVGNTGYFYIVEDERKRIERGRRPSAIHIKFLEIPQSNKKFIIVYGFLSMDWLTNKLRYSGAEERKVPVSRLDIIAPDGVTQVKQLKSLEEFLLEVFNAAFKFVVEILSQRCRGSKRAWGG